MLSEECTLKRYLEKDTANIAIIIRTSYALYEINLNNNTF